MRKTEKKH